MQPELAMQVSILKKLRAENVVRFLGVCVQGNRTMLITEFMAGGDLQRQLAISRGELLGWYSM